MGASGWIYYVEHHADPRVLLATLHQRVLDEGDYYWCDADVPRPATLSALHDLYRDEYTQHLSEEGTHSILDVYNVGSAGSPDDYGTILPLSPARVRAVFGTDTPTREQFDAVYAGGADLLDEFPRWSGRFTALHENGVPTQIVIWGFSGD